MSDVEIKTHMYPGYGSARGGYHVWAVYKNHILEEERGSESLEEMGRAAAQMEARWFPLSDAALEEAIKGKPLASPLCSNCGLPTDEGSISCLDKIWCDRPACRQALEDAIVASKEAQAQRAVKFAEEQAEASRARVRHVEEVTVGFHWRDGWFFRRLEDGSVGIARRNGSEWLTADLIIPPNEWASIVASVSAAGETGETWRAALNAQEPHNG